MESAVTWTLSRGLSVAEVGEGRRQTERTHGHAGSRLNRGVSFGRSPSDMLALKPYWAKPAVRILEGAMETSASFEARSAPSSYSTAGSCPPMNPSALDTLHG